MGKIPLSVIVVTKNEEARIVRCLEALQGFDEVLVVDSASTDKTVVLAEQCGARVINFTWNGNYPKKRQWSLDNLKLKHDLVFFVDADEVVPPELVEEISALVHDCAGCFVKGRYIFKGRPLRFGLYNNKLALFDRRKMEFPVVDDLDLPGMGEIEGHYQPVLKEGYKNEKIGQLREPLYHYAYEDEQSWQERHHRYADWERGMDAQNTWPDDPRPVKKIFKALPLRPWIAFLHSYMIKLGFLDGAAGFKFAQSRYVYYRMIENK